MRHHDPMAAENFCVRALGIGREYTLRPAFKTIEFPGDQSLEGDLVVLELRDLDLEALFGGEPG